MDYTDPPKSDSMNVGPSSDRGLISMIDRKMEEHFKNLLHVMEGLNVRMCQLESRTRKIEDSVDELKDSSEFNHGRTEGKLRQLGNILTEVLLLLSFFPLKLSLWEIFLERCDAYLKCL